MALFYYKFEYNLPIIGSSDDLELFLDMDKVPVDNVGLPLPFDGKLVGGNDNKVCGTGDVLP